MDKPKKPARRNVKRSIAPSQEARIKSQVHGLVEAHTEAAENSRDVFDGEPLTPRLEGAYRAFFDAFAEPKRFDLWDKCSTESFSLQRELLQLANRALTRLTDDPAVAQTIFHIIADFGSARTLAHLTRGSAVVSGAMGVGGHDGPGRPPATYAEWAAFQFNRCWPFLEPSLVEAPPGTSREGVWKLIQAERAQLWPGAASAIVTHIVSRHGERPIALPLLAGGVVPEVGSIWFRNVVPWASERGLALRTPPNIMPESPGLH